MITKYGELKKGDLIGVCYGNYIYLAIFDGEGKKGNIQFYPFWHILYRIHKLITTPIIKKGYIVRKELEKAGIVVKINPEDLTDPQDQQDYLDVKNYLNQIGV